MQRQRFDCGAEKRYPSAPRESAHSTTGPDLNKNAVVLKRHGGRKHKDNYLLTTGA
jgi:hypothetical protein